MKTLTQLIVGIVTVELVLLLTGCTMKADSANNPVPASGVLAASNQEVVPAPAVKSVQAEPDPDEAVLIQLQKAGSNLAKPHTIDFYLYFLDKSAADQAASKMRLSGYGTLVRKAAKGDDWLCLGRKSLIPELSAIQETTRQLTELATSLKGSYDGWEANVEK